jgi:hypothetical protein
VLQTGRGVRVAVIDSGVNTSHPHIARVDGGFPEDFSDRLGHGTAVMAAIQEKAPDAEYFAVRVFGGALRTNIDSLVRAVEWCVETNIDVINLSLGTTNLEHAARFEPFLKKAIIVAAAGAFPGDLDGVVGVALDPDCPRDEYRYDGKIFHASGFPRPVPGVPPERNLNGVSFAVANMTGFVVRACEGVSHKSHETVIGRLM